MGLLVAIPDDDDGDDDDDILLEGDTVMLDMKVKILGVK
jgi:hypothetical protein